MLALGLAMGVMSCGVTGPDEAPWGDVAAFSWPTTQGAMMKYRVEEKGIDTNRYRHETSQKSDEYTYAGQSMMMLFDEEEGVRKSTHFLPLKDTLVTVRDRTGALYALVAPLEKNRTWISAYGPDSIPTQKATVIERFSELKLEGTVYQNVIVVKYQPMIESNEYWIRFYARDIGAILTLKHVVPAQGSIVDPEPEPLQRTLLVEHSGS
jgi:hypothetical protein